MDLKLVGLDQCPALLSPASDSRGQTSSERCAPKGAQRSVWVIPHTMLDKSLFCHLQTNQSPVVKIQKPQHLCTACKDQEKLSALQVQGVC